MLIQPTAVEGQRFDVDICRMSPVNYVFFRRVAPSSLIICGAEGFCGPSDPILWLVLRKVWQRCWAVITLTRLELPKRITRRFRIYVYMMMVIIIIIFDYGDNKVRFVVKSKIKYQTGTWSQCLIGCSVSRLPNNWSFEIQFLKYTSKPTHKVSSALKSYKIPKIQQPMRPLSCLHLILSLHRRWVDAVSCPASSILSRCSLPQRPSLTPIRHFE